MDGGNDRLRIILIDVHLASKGVVVMSAVTRLSTLPLGTVPLPPPLPTHLVCILRIFNKLDFHVFLHNIASIYFRLYNDVKTFSP